MVLTALLGLAASLVVGCAKQEGASGLQDFTSDEADQSTDGGSGCPFDFDVSALEEVFADMPYQFERDIEEDGVSRECLWVWNEDWLVDELGFERSLLMGDQIAFYVYVTSEPQVNPPVTTSVEAGGYTVDITDAPPSAEGASLQTDDGTWVILTVAVPGEDFEVPRDAMVQTAVTVADSL